MRKAGIILKSTSLAAALTFLTGCFKVSSDVQTLSRSAAESIGSGAHRKFQLGVGRFTVGAAQLGAKFLELPDEARSLLGAMKGAEVSLWEVCGPLPKGGYAAILSKTDKAMEARGWERLAGVIKENEMVAAYIPASFHSTRSVKACVLVLNRDQMVCASAKADPEALLLAIKDHLQPSTLRDVKIAQTSSPNY